MRLAAFFLLLNTSPLNAAVINSVGAHIRATALAVNIFIIHILGDVPSPTMMGWVADKRSLQTAFILPVIAMGRLFCHTVLWNEICARGAADSAACLEAAGKTCRLANAMTYFHWIAGTILALAWFSRIVDAALGMPSVADISRPEWDRIRSPPPAIPAFPSLFLRATKKRHRTIAHHACSHSTTTIMKSSPSTIARPIARAKSWRGAIRPRKTCHTLASFADSLPEQ